MTHKSKLFLLAVLIPAYFFLMTYRSFYGYFDTDDILILSWTHIQSPIVFIKDTFNFETLRTDQLYRPVGALAFSVSYWLFGLNFLAFHLIATAIHLFNVFLLYRLIQILVPGKNCAMLGGFIFSFHITNISIYWFFYSFDLLCATFLLLSFFFYIKSSNAFNLKFLLSFSFFIFAIRSKEMAFTFPLILATYEILVSRKINEWRKSLRLVCLTHWPFYAITITAILLKLSASLKVETQHPYALDFKLHSILESLHFYLTSALNFYDMPLIATCLLLVILAILPVVFRSTTLAFSYIFVLSSLLPVLPLAAHRTNYYLYVPFLGVSIYAAELFRCFQNKIQKIRPKAVYSLHFVILFLWIIYSINNLYSRQKTDYEETFLNFTRNNRELIQLLQPLKPNSKAVFLFDSAPEGFDENGMLSIVRLIFHDWDIRAMLVKECNPSLIAVASQDIYCVSLKNRMVFRGMGHNYFTEKSLELQK